MEENGAIIIYILYFSKDYLFKSFLSEETKIIQGVSAK